MIQVAEHLSRTLDMCMKEQKAVRIIIGDGIWPQSYIKSQAAFCDSKGLDREKCSEKQVEKEYWDHLEYYRFICSVLPVTSPYVYLGILIETGLVDLIISTNYDTILENYAYYELKSKRLVLNPCSAIPAKLCDGFAGNEIGPQDTNSIPYYKIHGTLDYIAYFKCRHIFRLPRIRVPWFDGESKYSIPVFHHCLANEGSEYKIPGMLDEVIYGRDTGNYAHLIDTNFDRDIFRDIVDEALKRLINPLPGLILTIGFRGAEADDGYGFEELVDPIIEAAGKKVNLAVLLAEPDSETGYGGQEDSYLKERIEALGETHALASVCSLKNVLEDAFGSCSAIKETREQIIAQYSEYQRRKGLPRWMEKSL